MAVLAQDLAAEIDPGDPGRGFESIRHFLGHILVWGDTVTEEDAENVRRYFGGDNRDDD